MKQVSQAASTDLSLEERNLLSVAFKNLISNDDVQKRGLEIDSPATAAEWLKPGNHYSHWLRLRDGRLLLTWTHRNNVIDDDGYGTGAGGGAYGGARGACGCDE